MSGMHDEAAECFLHDGREPGECRQLLVDVQCRLLEIKQLLCQVQHVSMRRWLLQRTMRGKRRCLMPGMHDETAECFLHDGREPMEYGQLLVDLQCRLLEIHQFHTEHVVEQRLGHEYQRRQERVKCQQQCLVLGKRSQLFPKSKGLHRIDHVLRQVQHVILRCRVLQRTMRDKLRCLMLRMQRVSMWRWLLQRTMRGKLRCRMPGMHDEAAECFLHDGREPMEC